MSFDFERIRQQQFFNFGFLRCYWFQTFPFWPFPVKIWLSVPGLYTLGHWDVETYATGLSFEGYFVVKYFIVWYIIVGYLPVVLFLHSSLSHHFSEWDVSGSDISYFYFFSCKTLLWETSLKDFSALFFQSFSNELVGFLADTYFYHELVDDDFFTKKNSPFGLYHALYAVGFYAYQKPFVCIFSFSRYFLSIPSYFRVVLT